MRERSLLILAVGIILCVSVISATILLGNNGNSTDSNNTTVVNNSSNISLNESNNTTNNTSTQTTTKKTTGSSSKKSNSDSGYHYSEQYGDYVKEYTDSNGVQHIDTKGGIKESYNPKTNVLTTRDSKGNTYQDYMS